MSSNGKLLFDIIEEENLILVNATSKCLGTITRQRKTTKRTEKSVLDYFIVCRELFELLIGMQIDEERNYVLTKYTSRLGVKKIVESDHNPMWCTFNIPWLKTVKSDRKTAFKLKDVESQKAFKQYNENNDKLVSCITESSNIAVGGKKWFK